MKLILLMCTHLRVFRLKFDILTRFSNELWLSISLQLPEVQGSYPRGPILFFKVRDKCCYLTADLQFGS